MSFPVKHISTTIKRTAEDIYNFVSNPINLPQWAAGLSGATITRVGEDWVSESPMGLVKIKFAENNKFGIMDHYVTLPDGSINYNPFRVFKNGDSSEVVFTLFRLPPMSEQDFKNDAEMITSDLNALKNLLEKSAT